MIENNEIKILLSPLNGIIFNISPRTGLEKGGKSIILDTPKKIRVVDANQKDKQKYMLHLKDLNTPQKLDKLLDILMALNLPRSPLAISMFLWIIEFQENYKPVNHATMLENFIERLFQKPKLVFC